jgi:hypothetical protein
VKKDKETAIMYLKKGLELDPENVNFQKTLQVLQTPSKPATPAKPNTPAKPQTKSSSSSNAAKKPAGKKG